jgi:streptomycin 6-kinase
VTLVPAGLPVVTHLSRIPAAQPWLAGLPALIEAVTAEFGLRTGPPLHGGSCSWVAPATLPDGTPVIVKIGWPHREMLGEPVALRLWNGGGAVRLLDHSPARHALVLQRCVPGRELAASPVPDDEALHAGCAVLRRLWRAPLPAPGELESLAEVAAEWADLIEDRMARLRPGYDPGLVALGASLMRSLPGSAGAAVVLHGDLNPGNILSHGEDWLAIDPKPMTGDPAYDPWPLLSQVGGTFDDPAPLHRAGAVRVAGELGIDAGRMVRWSLARRVEAALWSADHGDPAGGASYLGAARAYADLADRL